MRQHHDRIGETSTTTGTVPFVLAGAISGHRTFGSVSADGEKRVYHADDDNGNWEVGLGTYNASANTFRATSNADVWASSNGGNLVDFPSGIKHIVHGQSAEEVPFIRSPGDPRWHVPATDGSNNQVLATDGSGQLKWADPASLDDAVILSPETSDRNVITPAAIGVVPISINGLPGQAADLQRWQVGGATLASVTAQGNLFIFRDPGQHAVGLGESPAQKVNELLTLSNSGRHVASHFPDNSDTAFWAFHSASNTLFGRLTCRGITNAGVGRLHFENFTRVVIDTPLSLSIAAIPVGNPNVAGQVYRDGTDLRISTG